MSSNSGSEKKEITKREEPRGISRRAPRHYIEDIFDDFRRDIEDFMERSWWPSSSFPTLPSLSWRAPVLREDMRMALCDVVDKGDKYELQVEVPGIEKEKIDVKATKNSVEISGEQSEKAEEKRRNYVYNERSYRSFQRRIPIPEEIVPSKIDAKMNNGILQIQLPKKVPSKPEEETTKVEVK